MKCDVLIIGGGPAGLFSALKLSNKGFSIVILEKDKNVGSKQTKYDITEGYKIQKILDEVGIQPQKISQMSEWISPNYSYVLDSKIKDFYFKRGFQKDSIENILLKKLHKKNVDIFYESTIDSIEHKKKKISTIRVNTISEKITINPKYVIGADGPKSELRKRLKIDSNIFVKFKGFGVIVETEKDNVFPFAKIYFNEQLAPGGYLYSGSVGNEVFFCIVIDNIFSKKISFQENIKKILEKNIDHDFKVKNYFSGIGISGISEARVENVLFTGGAALFYDPFLGYGLNYAIESAYVATQAIMKNKIEIYTVYSKKIQKEFKSIYFAREIWRNANNKFFDKLIKAFYGKIDRKDKKVNKIIELFGKNDI
jgi:flavin-dependent dehydrogenase